MTTEEVIVPVSRTTQLWYAFRNFALLFSFVVNLVLVIVVLLLVIPFPGPVFLAKTDIVQPLLLNLDEAFAALGETTILTDVEIDHTMPVVFDLPLQQDTVVVLTEAVPLQAAATFFLPAGGGSINGTVSLNLPEGMELPVHLDLMVPVSTTVPVEMVVPVEIQLSEAGMGPAIFQLREVFRPLREFIEDLPDTPQDALRPQ